MYLLIHDVNLMVTRNCNFNCDFCLRGNSYNENISLKVIKRLFQKNIIINNLHLNGGEVFTNPKLLSRIITEMITSGVQISCVSIITNGTLFTEEIEHELERLEQYLLRFESDTLELPRIKVVLSVDKFHKAVLKRIEEDNPILYAEYLDNLTRLRKSRFLFAEKDISAIINSGRAQTLSCEKVEPFKQQIYYHERLKKIFVISHLGIDINGDVCDTNGKMPPEADCIYGNIIKTPISEIVQKYGIKCSTSQEVLKRLVEEMDRISKIMQVESNQHITLV